MQLAIQNFVNPQLLIYQQKNDVNRQVYGLSLQPALSCDKVCFSGQNVDFLKLPKKEIYKRVQESINNFNLLGYGTEGSVYAIDGTDYCIKFSRNSDSRKSLCKNLTFKVSEQDKVNHVVAKLGNSAVIMQKIKGIPVSEINKMSFEEIEDDVYKLLSLPNSAYRDLLLQIISALKKGMEFDCHGGNLIVDFDKKKLTAIDFFPPQRYYNEQPLSKMYYPFLSINNISSKIELGFARKVFDVLLDELKPNVTPKIDFKDIDVLSFLYDLSNDNLLNIKTRQIAQINEAFEQLIKLKTLENSGVDVSKDFDKIIVGLNKILDKHLPHLEPKSNNQISFTGQKISLLDLPKEEVFKLVKQCIDPKNGLGIGGQADVYAIPNTDYCVRLIGLNGEAKSYATRYKDYTADFSKDISPQDAVNHVVVKLGNGASIMRRIKGEPLLSYFREAEEQAEVTSKILKFPISAYSQLFRQVAEADKVGMVFDMHPANVIVDFDNKTFTAIDFQHSFVGERVRPLEYLFSGLDTTAKFEDKLLLLNKVFKAGLEEFKPKVKPCYSLEQFDFMRLLKHVSQLFYLDYREFLKFEQHILELTHLKSLELKGRDVGDRLQALISEISEKFDKLTVFLC